jgi:muramoyltetrapeptide carboxypeptidase
MRAWTDPGVSAVFCARGGYGAQRMLDRLDWPTLAAAGPKVLVGFSDVTALHQAFASRLGLSTLHGPVVTSLGAGDEESREHLRAMLFDPVAGTSLTPAPARTLVPGRGEGVLVGGNLALVAAEVGTATSWPAAESIVVLEDVGEEVYRLDRLLTQLSRSGWLDRARGVVLGQFTDCGSPESLADLFTDRLGSLGLPLLMDAPFGHAARNLAFPFGVPAVLDAGAGTLQLRAAALL